MNPLKWIDGHKTKIGAVLFALATALKALDVITPEQFQTAIGILAAWGFYSVRDAIRKVEKK